MRKDMNINQAVAMARTQFQVALAIGGALMLEAIFRQPMTPEQRTYETQRLRILRKNAARGCLNIDDLMLLPAVLGAVPAYAYGCQPLAAGMRSMILHDELSA